MSKRSRPVMSDVAELAGVSVMTVSRVLQGEARTAEATKRKVRAAVRELGYRRDENARNLRIGRRSGVIGLVVTNLANPYHSQLALGVGETAEQHGLRVILVNSGEDQCREMRLVDDLLGARVEGIIIAPASDSHGHLAPARLHGTPVVLTASVPTGISADCVLVDDYAGTKEATDRLIARGHTKIGFLGLPPTLFSGAERLRGFRAAMSEAHLKASKRYIRYQPSDIMEAERTARALLGLVDPPSALFAANNRNMIGAIRAINVTCASVALAGFDDFELADMLNLPLTVVAYEPAEVGREATRLLWDRMANEGSTISPRRVIVPTRVIDYGLSGSGRTPGFEIWPDNGDRPFPRQSRL